VGVLLEAGTAYPSRTHEFAPGFFGGVLVAHDFSFLCCPIMCRYVLSSIKTMFGLSLPPVVCKRVHVLFTLFVCA